MFDRIPKLTLHNHLGKSISNTKEASWEHLEYWNNSETDWNKHWNTENTEKINTEINSNLGAFNVSLSVEFTVHIKN